MIDSCKTLQDVMLKNKDIEDRGITFIYADDKEVFVSYKNLYEKVLYFLGYLQAKGMKENDKLIVLVEENYNFVITLWACLMGKIVPVPLTFGRNEEHFAKFIRIYNLLEEPFVLFDEKSYKNFLNHEKNSKEESCLNQVGKKIIHVEEFNTPLGSGNIVKCDEDDIAFIQFSSGSTGIPKGVMLSHKNLISNTEGILEGIQCTLNDSSLSWMPLTHDMGLIGFHLSPFRRQINHYLMQTSLFIYRPLLWIKKASEHRVTVLSSPNFGYKYFLKIYLKNKEQCWNLDCVRVIFNGAEPISIKVCNEFLDIMSRFGLKRNTMFTVYGLAEASLAVAFPKVEEEIKIVNIDRRCMGIGDHIRYCDDENHITCVNEGYPVKHCNIRICDENNVQLGENIVGYIQIKGTNVTRGFYKSPEDSKDIIDAEGWLNTKDLGFVHEGQLIVTGRAKDIIFVNGVNYYSHDIEDVLVELDSIELGKVAVCGYHNSKNQREEIIIFVEFRGKVESFVKLIDEIRGHIMLRLGIYVDYIIPIKKMPKTTSGKLQRFKLINSYMNHEFHRNLREIEEYRENIKGGKDSDKELTATEQRLINIYTQVFNNTNISVDDNLINIGGDSITLTKIQGEINNEYPDKVNIANLFSYPSVRKLADFIDNQKELLEPSAIINNDLKGDVSKRECVTYKYILDKEKTEKMYDLLRQKEYSCEIFLFAVYYYILFQKTNNERIVVYTRISGWNGIRAICIEDKECDTFDDFVKLVVDEVDQSCKENNFAILKRLRKKRNLNYIWISFLYNHSPDAQVDLNDVFDFNLILSESDNNEISIKSEVNTEWIGKEISKDIFHAYVSMLLYLIEVI